MLQPTGRRRPEGGFTLVEMAISLFILVIVIVGVLGLFDLASRIGRAQVDVADLQQSMRGGQYEMVRMVRMAGRGGVLAGLPRTAPYAIPANPPPPLLSLPRGMALAVINNVGADTFMDAPANTKRILEGTDVLTVRGAFNAPVYGIADGSFLRAGNAGSFEVKYYPRVNLPLPQNLQLLADAIDRVQATGIPEALLLLSPLDAQWFHVVELTAASSVTTMGDPDGTGPEGNQPMVIRVVFNAAASGNQPGDSYWWLSGSNWDGALTTPTYMAILEEYRYYVIDDNREIPGNLASGLHPRLVRARVYPGTQQQPVGTGLGGIPYENRAENWAVTVAENVTDLQLALGIETGLGSPFEPDEGGDPPLLLAKPVDEWLYNTVGDDSANTIKWANGRLFYLRLTTTVFTERRDTNYRTPQPVGVTTEDHVYNIWDPATPPPAKLLTPDQRYRRRSLRSVVDLRNLS